MRRSTPTTQRIDPATGRAFAVFPGGVELPLDTAAGNAQNSIRWVRQPDGAYVITDTGYGSPSGPGGPITGDGSVTRFGDISATDRTAESADNRFASVRATSMVTRQAGLEVRATGDLNSTYPGGREYVGAYTSSSGAGKRTKIIDGDGASDFLQLVASGRRRIANSSGGVGLPFSASQFGSVTFPHGGGQVPITVLALPNDSNCKLAFGGSDANNITITGKYDSVVTGNVFFFWAAFF